MRLIDPLYRLFKGGKPEAGLKAGLPIQPCPNEAQILTYSEGKLSSYMRKELETHFAICNDCRSLLVLLTQFNNEPFENATPVSEEVVKKQTARILAFIENDEEKRNTAPNKSGKPVWMPREKKGFFVSYPQLAMAALVICAVSVGILVWQLNSQKAETAAMRTLELAMKDERRSETRISGGFKYSPYTVTRGAAESDDVELKKALNQLKSAEDESASVKTRLALVRVHLAFEKPEHTQRALVILGQLMSQGVESPELLNDHGVANYQIQKYDEAIEDFNKALDKKPDYLEALFNKALAEDRSSRYQDAKRSWQRFIEFSSDAEWIKEAKKRLDTLSKSPNQ